MKIAENEDCIEGHVEDACHWIKIDWQPYIYSLLQRAFHLLSVNKICIQYSRNDLGARQSLFSWNFHKYFVLKKILMNATRAFASFAESKSKMIFTKLKWRKHAKRRKQNAAVCTKLEWLQLQQWVMCTGSQASPQRKQTALKCKELLKRGPNSCTSAFAPELHRRITTWVSVCVRKVKRVGWKYYHPQTAKQSASQPVSYRANVCCEWQSVCNLIWLLAKRNGPRVNYQAMAHTCTRLHWNLKRVARLNLQAIFQLHSLL